jgi:hypothetical protein
MRYNYDFEWIEQNGHKVSFSDPKNWHQLTPKTKLRNF